MYEAGSTSHLPEVEEITTPHSMTQAEQGPDFRTIAFKHVLQLLELIDEAVEALYVAKITYIRRLIVTRMDHL